jgi:folate-dependent phosphoribosylglycinamide formyltransferase PurN
MLRRVCSKHTHHVQISHSQACPCDRPVYAPQLSSYFLHKGRRRPRQKYLRENTIRPSSFLTSYPGLTVRNINCQYRLHSAGAAFSTFSDLHARSSASTSTDDHESGHIKRNNRTTWPTDLPQQLMFLFSDLNLRNNKHARSTLIDDQYLPLKELLEIKSIKNITSNVDATTGDPAATVMDAIDLVNKNVAHTIKLHTEQLNNGDIIVRRSPPFRYSESIHNHHERMMVIEGWAHRPRWALSHIRMMLSNDTSVTGGSSYFDKGMHTIDSNNTPMTYWRYDHALRVLNIEFKSDNGALAAWVNLERAASSQEAANSLGIEVYRLPSEGKAARKAYKLQIGETVLIARSIDLPTTTHMTDFILFDPSSNIPHQDSIITKTPVAVPPPGYNKIWETNEMPTLSQFTDAMNKLYQYHISLAPSVSGDSSDEQLLSRQQDLYADVLHLVSSAKASMDQGEIRALRGKDGYALSDLLSRAMLIYSETPFEDSGKLSGGPITPFDACVDVLHMLRELNLDINPSHYTHALRAACNESRWREASRLFLTQVDGDGDDEFNPNATGGYVPIDPELAWEGLYAVACDSKSSDSTGERTTPSPSKRVFDTAMKMSMISPSSQERCK